MAAQWTEERVFQDGEEFYSELCQAIQMARLSIHLETYIFDRDSLGKEVLDCLRDAARRGVRVRLLLDGVGCSSWTYLECIGLGRDGVQLRFFHPLSWQNPSYRLWKSLTLRRILLGLWKLNRRNHRKSCIIDDQVAFLGGMNISARHSVRFSGIQAWRDTSVRVQGEAIRYLAQAFEEAWNHSQRKTSVWPHKLESGPGILRLNITNAQRTAIYKDLVLRILAAKQRVWITTPYFLPDIALIRALRYAAWTGADVRLLLPKRHDIWGLKRITESFYSILLHAKVRIFEYGPSILHAKVTLLDDWAMVGSTNLNHRSLLTDLEVDVVLSRPETISQLQQQFIDDLSHSKEINAKSWNGNFWLARGLERLALLFRRWL